MMEQLAGKVALVTGGASGIGLGIARELAAVGATLVLADIDGAQLDAAADALGDSTTVVPEVLDVSHRQAWEASAARIEARFGGIDVLVNNAGVGSAKQPVEQISERDWNWIFSINVHGVRNGLATWVPRMKARGSAAHIVNTASILGHFALPGASDYVAAKFAVVGMTECLRLELAGTPIGVSLLCPGLVATPLSHTRSERMRRDRGEAPATEPPPARGIDAARVGADVVRAIRANTFYVFTHPDYEAVVALRNADMLRDFSRGDATGEDISMLAGPFLSLPRA